MDNNKKVICMKYEYKSEAKLRQQMFNNRLKIKYVCHECGHVHYNSALTMLVHSILCISIFCIVGTSAVIFVDNVLVVAALDEFLDVALTSGDLFSPKKEIYMVA